MSVKLTQTYLTSYENGEYTSFLKELVYSGVRFQLLDPNNLGKKWSGVEFVSPNPAQTDNIRKLDAILSTRKSKGFFSAFIDDRQTATFEDIKALHNGGTKNHLYNILDKLSQYNKLNSEFIESQKLDNKDESESLSLDLKNRLTELSDLGFNPENLSEQNYKQLSILHSDLELENILSDCEKLVFSVGDKNSYNKALYCFISIHPDFIEKFEKIADKHSLPCEKVSWEKEIVVWQQSDNLTPFKAVAESLGTISTKQVDPSALISIFFSLFFAFCLSDAIYGIILSLFCGYFLFFKKLKPQFQNIFRLFFISGVATIVFGALLNSWAGDLFVKTPAGPLLESLQLINPLDPTAKVPVNKFLLGIGLSPIVAMLGLSIVIGLVNILSGYILKAVNEYRSKRIFSLLGELNWIAFIAFLIFWIVLAGIGSDLAVVALGLLGLATLGFFILNDGKSVVQKIIAGFGKIYSLISFGADVLSFTRLVAVGLTSGIIANVINLLGVLIFESIPVPGLNILGLAIVLVIGHTFNLVISLFGAYINPLRLHYVEFLPKFYDAEGEKLVSLKTDFKYLKLV
jgi:vacuolar-type H+-ATPase subunit I/STV1